MSNYTAGGFLGEWVLSAAISTAFLGLVIAGLYMLVRRVRERWVWWATGFTAVMILFVFTVQPVVVEPLFNDYQPLPAGEVRESILALARGGRGPGRRRVLVQRLETDQAHQRERFRSRGHRAHRAQRQPAERHFAARDPRGHGPRDGPLPPAPRHQARGRHSRSRSPSATSSSTGCSAGCSGATATASASATSPILRGCRSRSRSSRS